MIILIIVKNVGICRYDTITRHCKPLVYVARATFMQNLSEAIDISVVYFCNNNLPTEKVRGLLENIKPRSQQDLGLIFEQSRSVSFLLYGIVYIWEKRKYGRARAKNKVPNIFKNIYL